MPDRVLLCALGLNQASWLPPKNLSDVDWKIKIAQIDAILDEPGRSEANDKERFVLGKMRPKGLQRLPAFQ